MFKDHLAATFRFGVFQATSRSDQNGAGNRYKGEGLATFDLAMNARVTATLLELLEQMTNVGGELATERYKGKAPTLRCSVLVFANKPVHQKLKHRVAGS